MICLNIKTSENNNLLVLKTRTRKCITSSPNNFINHTVKKSSQMTNKQTLTFGDTCAVKTRNLNKVSEHANVPNAKKKFKTKPWERIQQEETAVRKTDTVMDGDSKCVCVRDLINLTVVLVWSQGKHQGCLVIITCQPFTHADNLQDTRLTVQTSCDVTERLLSESKCALTPVITAYFKELVPLTFNSHFQHLEQSRSYLEKKIQRSSTSNFLIKTAI